MCVTMLAVYLNDLVSVYGLGSYIKLSYHLISSLSSYLDGCGFCNSTQRLSFAGLDLTSGLGEDM